MSSTNKRSPQCNGRTRSPLFLTRLTGTSPGTDADSPPAPRPLDLSFAQTMSFLNPLGGQPDSANAIQVATTRFQRAVMELRRAEAEVAAMRNDRLLLVLSASNRPPTPGLPTASGNRLDAVSFGVLADRVIEEQAVRVLDLHEVARAEVAALDGQLKRLTTAFEEDLRRQFYKPVLEDVRRDSRASKVRMGQIQTTTIRTNDRLLARVSPGQTVVLDRPVRPVLLQEGLQVAQGLAQEAQSLAQSGRLQAASNMVAPANSAVLAQAGLTPVPGQHLEQLVGQSERITVSAGDDISVTPVIQADGFSVAFHLVYTHTPHAIPTGRQRSPAACSGIWSKRTCIFQALRYRKSAAFEWSWIRTSKARGFPCWRTFPGRGRCFGRGVQSPRPPRRTSFWSRRSSFRPRCRSRGKAGWQWIRPSPATPPRRRPGAPPPRPGRPS